MRSWLGKPSNIIKMTMQLFNYMTIAPIPLTKIAAVNYVTNMLIGSNIISPPKFQNSYNYTKRLFTLFNNLKYYNIYTTLDTNGISTPNVYSYIKLLPSNKRYEAKETISQSINNNIYNSSSSYFNIISIYDKPQTN